MSSNIESNGWTAVSASVSAILSGKPKIADPKPLLVSQIPLPDSKIAQKILAYAKLNLPLETYNHSLRVYYFGRAITLTQFPHWAYTPEIYLLSCLLHDIGTTPANISATNMSFEFYGGMLAHALLLGEGEDRDVADAVAEAVIRHQDIRHEGMITTVGQVLQMATLLDNMGLGDEMVHQSTVEDVVSSFPRLGWSGCFAKTIREECGLKPWCHTTSLGVKEFPEGVLANDFMNKYE